MGRDFKVTPGFTGSSRPAWDTREPVLLCFGFKVSCLERKISGEGAGRPQKAFCLTLQVPFKGTCTATWEGGRHPGPQMVKLRLKDRKRAVRQHAALPSQQSQGAVYIRCV